MDISSIYVVPNIAAMIDEKLVSFLESKGIKLLPGILGSIVNNVMASLDLQQAIKDLGHATNKYDEELDILRISVDSAMLTLSLAEWGASIFLGTTLGPVGGLVTLTLVVGQMIAAAIIEERKICDQLGCSGQERWEIFENMLLGGSIPEYILDDLKAKEWYGALLSQAAQLLVNSGYDALATSLPDIWEVETLQFTGKTLSSTEYGNNLVYCEIDSISTNTTLEVTAKSSVEIKSWVNKNQYSPPSRILTTDLGNISLICNPTAANVQKEIIHNIGCSDSSVVPCHQSKVYNIEGVRKAQRELELVCHNKTGETFTSVRSKTSLPNQNSATKQQSSNTNTCSAAVVLATEGSSSKAEGEIELLHYNIYPEKLPEAVKNIRFITNNDKCTGGKNADTLIVREKINNYTIDAKEGEDTLLITGDMRGNRGDVINQVSNIEHIVGTSNSQIVTIDNSVFSGSNIKTINFNGGGDILEVYYEKINTEESLTIDLYGGDTLLLDSQDVTHKKAPLNLRIWQEITGDISISLPILGQRILQEVAILLPYTIEQMTIKHWANVLYLEVDDNGDLRTIKIDNYNFNSATFAHLFLQQLFGTIQPSVEIIPIIPKDLAKIQRMTGDLSLATKIIKEVHLKVLIPSVLNNTEDFLLINDLKLLKNDNHIISISARTPNKKYIIETHSSSHIISTNQMEDNKDIQAFYISIDSGGDTYGIDDFSEVVIDGENSQQTASNTILFNIATNSSINIDISQKHGNVIIQYNDEEKSGQVTLERYCKQFNNKSFKVVKNDIAYELISNENGELEVLTTHVDKVKLITIPKEKSIAILSAEELAEYKTLYMPSIEKASDLEYYRHEQKLILRVKNTDLYIIIYDFYQTGIKDEIRYNDINLLFANDKLDAVQVYNKVTHATSYLDEITHHLKKNYIIFLTQARLIPAIANNTDTECDKLDINQPFDTGKKAIIDLSDTSPDHITFQKDQEEHLLIHAVQFDGRRNHTSSAVTEKCLVAKNWDEKKEHRGIIMTNEGGVDLSNCMAAHLSNATLSFFINNLTNNCIQKIFWLGEGHNIQKRAANPAPEKLHSTEEFPAEEYNDSYEEIKVDEEDIEERYEDSREYIEDDNNEGIKIDSVPSKASKAQPFVTEFMDFIGDNIGVLYVVASNSVKQLLNQLRENSPLELTHQLFTAAELPVTSIAEDEIEDGYVEDVEDEEVAEQKNCQVITNVKKDYKNGQASLIYSSHCENNDGVTINMVEEKVCQLKFSQATCTPEHCEIEEEIVCPDSPPPKYYDYSKAENTIGTLAFLVTPIYLILYSIGYLRGNREKELRDDFVKHEELKNAPIEEYLRKALICQNTIHEFEKILTNTKSKFIISQFNSIPVNILENINEPWLSKWYKIFGKTEWLSKLAGYKDKVTFFENLEDIKNITKDGIDVTLENINEPWLSKWYKIFGKTEWLSNLLGYKDKDKICDEIYNLLLELDPTLKTREVFYQDLTCTEDAIQDIKIKCLVSNLQQQKTISNNQIECLQISNENIRELIQNKGNTTTNKYEQHAHTQLLNVHDNNYQETTGNNYNDSLELIGV